jgi:hypothetical protein
MDSGDYTNNLYNEIKAAREQLLQARIALVRVGAWLKVGEEEKWSAPVYAEGAMREMRAYNAWVESTQPKKEEVAP